MSENEPKGGREAADWKASQGTEKPFEDMNADERMAIPPEQLLGMAEAEEKKRTEGVAAAKAELAGAGPELTKEALDELADLEADLAEIEEIDQKIKDNIQWGNMSPEEKRHETERLAELQKEREAVERKMRAIKTGSPQGMQKTVIVRRVGIGKEDRRAPEPKKPWWKRLFGGK
jgi:hypothetical protein